MSVKEPLAGQFRRREEMRAQYYRRCPGRRDGNKETEDGRSTRDDRLPLKRRIRKKVGRETWKGEASGEGEARGDTPSTE